MYEQEGVAIAPFSEQSSQLDLCGDVEQDRSGLLRVVPHFGSQGKCHGEDIVTAAASAPGAGTKTTRRWRVVLWAQLDLNQRPHPYQGCALSELSYGPNWVEDCTTTRASPSKTTDRNCLAFVGCGDDRIRTDDPLVANQVLCQTELRPQNGSRIVDADAHHGNPEPFWRI